MKQEAEASLSFPSSDIGVSHRSLSNERCPPLAILQTIYTLLRANHAPAQAVASPPETPLVGSFMIAGFDTAHTAARAFDRASIKFRGVDADINFNLSDYEDDMKQMKSLSKE